MFLNAPYTLWIATVAVLVSTCSGDGPLINNPPEVDPVLDSNVEQFWAIPIGRAGYPNPLNEGQNPVPLPGNNPFPVPTQPGSGSPGGAAFYPGPLPGSVQLGYFSGTPSYPPGNYGFNGNGVFGFSIPANAVVQPQQNQQSSWGSGFWSRFNPANRVGSFFNFSQRQPVHQYAFSASITNSNNRPQNQNNPPNVQNNPANVQNNPPNVQNPQVVPHPYYFPSYQQQSQNWYNNGGFVPFGNPYLFAQNPQFSNNVQQNADPNNDKNPSYNRPSIPVYNPPNSVPDNPEQQNNSTDNAPTFTPSQPLRSGSESSRPGIWGENLRRNWLHVPWIGNLGNRDVSPRTDYPGGALFSFQG